MSHSHSLPYLQAHTQHEVGAVVVVGTVHKIFLKLKGTSKQQKRIDALNNCWNKVEFYEIFMLSGMYFLLKFQL